MRSVDIAEALGVSRTAVSFVLSNSPNAAKISIENRERIRALAAAWNYVPNRAATALRERRSGTIGVVFADLKHGWAERILEAMLPVLESRDTVAFITMSMWDADRERSEIDSMLGRQVDGIVVIAPSSQNLDVYRRVRRGGIPLVFMGDALAEDESFHRVVWHEGEAIEAAAGHLIGLGRERICFLEAQHPGLLRRERAAAFDAAVVRSGHAARPDPVIRVKPSSQIDTVLGASLADFDNPPDALLASNDALALDAVTWLERSGLRVPSDIAVIGLGDLPASALPQVSLSTVRPDPDAIGQITAEMLMDLIEDPAHEPIHRHVRSSEVIARSTTLGSTTPGSTTPDETV